ncbi:LysR family transcriptional regulator [Shinella sp. CPCC 101442]|uniref:LysR family transcriptional regulator n=1 Tax=Shinella sp. CPCC 101442 TaxID=2932265 RepID=UPI002152F023|nr:LysR family transcriptional regulator [Shinella sp. CPCC 101442]MCR6499482.1 LysR family transcriptional regulator [Shinella sp. CPCC 101442]
MTERQRRKQLANLRALRAFEAVGHHRSFTAAANELAVSQGAVSHQIKQLEERLGRRLLERNARGVSITSEGSLLLDVCARAFEEIANALSLIGQENETRILRIRTGPFFAMEVLVPRMAGFLEQNPGIQLHLSNLEERTGGYEREDAQISYCMHPPAGHYAVEVLRERLVPVCSPALLASVERGADLLFSQSVARLHYRNANDWKNWLAHNRLQETRTNANLFFDDQHTLLAAARSGHGIGFSHRAFLDTDIARGTLCVLSEDTFQPDESYQFICPKESIESNPPLMRFRDWLLQEVAAVR